MRSDNHPPARPLRIGEIVCGTITGTHQFPNGDLVVGLEYGGPDRLRIQGGVGAVSGGAPGLRPGRILEGFHLEVGTPHLRLRTRAPGQSGGGSTPSFGIAAR